MGDKKIAVLLIFTIFVGAQSKAIGLSQPSLSFAESLYQQSDYFNAATEFERYLFFNSTNMQNDSFLQNIKLKLTRSYFYSQESDKTEKILQELSSQKGQFAQEAQLQLAKLYIHEGDFFKAKIELNDLLLFSDQSNNQKIPRKEVYENLGYIALQEHELNDALGYFTQAEDSLLIANTKAMPKLPKKNVLLSQVLSSIVPGSGEIYCGRYGIGLLSFLVNSASVLGMVYTYKNKQYLDAALIFSLFFTRFYNGSRNNARDFAWEFNNRMYKQKFTEIENVIVNNGNREK